MNLYRVIVIVRQQFVDVVPDYFTQPLELICRPVREMLSRGDIDPTQNLGTIITVTGYKGGVGKSTTAFHLASYFSDLGKTVLIDGDPNRTAIKWVGRNEEALPFTVADERQAMKLVTGMDYVIIDTPARPNSDDLKELAKGCDLLILPTSPDVVSLEPMLETARDVGEAKFRALITIVPPHPSREGEVNARRPERRGHPRLQDDDPPHGGLRQGGDGWPPHQGRRGRARARAAWGDYKALGDEVKELLR